MCPGGAWELNRTLKKVAEGRSTVCLKRNDTLTYPKASVYLITDSNP